MSCIGVGDVHLGAKGHNEKLATRIIRTAIDTGVTFRLQALAGSRIFGS
jgi:hypothetical protein